MNKMSDNETLSDLPPTEITIEAALNLLARVHTRDDDLTGFCVQMGATPQPWDCSEHAYVQAWAAVRRAVHLRTKPGEYPAR